MARTHGSPKLRREQTGQARPSIRVHNAFVTTQHVFVDWVHVGEIAPGASATFEIDAGTHTLTSSESSDPDEYPVSITERFGPGYAYRYEISRE